MIKSTLIILVIAVLISPLFLYAQPYYPFGGGSGGNGGTGSGGTGQSQLENPLGSNGPNDIGAFIQKALDVLGYVGAVIVTIAMIYSGFLFVTAQGNEEKLQKAKRAFLYTVVGIAILMGAKLIVDIVTSTVKSI